MKSFKTGDTVKLKSGSPLMVVEGYNYKIKECVCCWFDSKNRKQTDFFAEETLIPIDK